VTKFSAFRSIQDTCRPCYIDNCLQMWQESV